MYGGNGDDSYFVDDPADRIADSAGNDSMLSSISFSLVSNPGIENLVLTGSAAINGTGDALANTLVGNLASNILSGGFGNDIFVFNKPLNASTNVDLILDFGTAVGDDDRIALDRAIFSQLSPGVLADSDFYRTSAPPARGFAHIAYDDANGALYYDPDGFSGPAARIHFATLSYHPALTAADFFVA